MIYILIFCWCMSRMFEMWADRIDTTKGPTHFAFWCVFDFMRLAFTGWTILAAAGALVEVGM